MKKFAKVALGALAGTVAGMVATPFYMVGDCLAPVSYPVMGAVGGACISESVDGNNFVGAAVGATVGFCCIPLAPWNFVQRIPLTPVAGAISGGIFAHNLD